MDRSGIDGIRGGGAPRAWWAGLGAAALLLAWLIAGCGGAPGEREYRAGIAELAAGRYVRAKALLEKSIIRRPASAENARAGNLLGLIHWRLGQVEAAREAFESARRYDPARPEPVYNLAVLVYRSGDLPRALELFTEAALLDPGGTRAQEFRAALLIGQRKWPEAQRELHGALARDPRSPSILTALAMVEQGAGRPTQAVFYLMRALEAQPGYAPALYNLARLHRDDLRDPEQARAYYARYLEGGASGPPADEARKYLSAAAPETPAAPAAPPPAAPAGPPPPRTLAEATARAEQARAAGDARGALEILHGLAERAGQNAEQELREQALREAVRLCPEQPEAHAALGRFLLARGAAAAAAPLFKKVLELDPASVRAQLGLAEAAMATGEFDAALVALKQAARAEPDQPDPLWMLAELYDRRLGLADQAVAAYTKFQQQFPGDPRVLTADERLRLLDAGAAAVAPPAGAPEAPGAVEPASAGRKLQFRRPARRDEAAALEAYNRGVRYQSQGDLERAVFDYTRAIETDDRFALAYYNLATVFEQQGDPDRAADAYAYALDLRPEMTNARFNLALLHYNARRPDQALAQLRELVAASPNYAPAYNLLGLLESQDPGQHAAARRHYRAFLDLAPDDPAAPAARRWLQSHP